MVRKVVAECDICGRPDAEEWHVSVEGRQWRLDLCPEEHGALLREMVSHGQEESAPGSTTPPGIRTRSYERLVRGVPPDPKG